MGRLIDSQRVGVLGTQYQDAPHQSLIAYIGSEDLRYVFFTAPADTRKVTAMERNPGVSFLIDSRQKAETDFNAASAVTIEGVAEPVADRQRDAIVSRYLERHPYMEDFVASASCRFFRIRVQRYTLVSRFQNVEELVLR